MQKSLRLALQAGIGVRAQPGLALEIEKQMSAGGGRVFALERELQEQASGVAAAERERDPVGGARSGQARAFQCIAQIAALKLGGVNRPFAAIAGMAAIGRPERRGAGAAPTSAQGPSGGGEGQLARHKKRAAHRLATIARRPKLFFYAPA